MGTCCSWAIARINSVAVGHAVRIRGVQRCTDNLAWKLDCVKGLCPDTAAGQLFQKKRVHAADENIRLHPKRPIS